jgi:hypothetical protein
MKNSPDGSQGAEFRGPNTNFDKANQFNTILGTKKIVERRDVFVENNCLFLDKFFIS